MDNLTHALVGAAIAECALPRPARAETRRVFMVAGVAAASAPDIDLVYTWITEAPLGYLLHHRGHSHTWPGLVVLGAAIMLAIRWWPAARTATATSSGRLAATVAVALASHLLLDAANVYGTHLLYPVTSRWYYGDAVFIFEPWVWVVLGTAVAMNARRPWTRRVLWALMAILPLVLSVVGLISTGALAALGAGLVALGAVLRGTRAHVRAGFAIGATVAMFATMTAVSRAAKASARHLLPAGPAVVDIAANPNPAVPWCWVIVTIERDRETTLIIRRGTLSLAPRMTPATGCASHRLLTAGSPESRQRDDERGASAAVRWDQEWRVDVRDLTAASADCRVAAWLQFGRVPFIDGDRIVDLRFDNPLGRNFSAMLLERARASGCPSYLTDWAWPRADVLRR